MTAIPLTTRQRQAYRFIAGFIAKDSRGPTLTEIKEGLGLRSLSPVQNIVARLVAKGAITRQPKVWRGIKLKSGGEFKLKKRAK